jgi:hypothetical protein
MRFFIYLAPMGTTSFFRIGPEHQRRHINPEKDTVDSGKYLPAGRQGF